MRINDFQRTKVFIMPRGEAGELAGRAPSARVNGLIDRKERKERKGAE
jgi:hypothetical protein